MADDPRPDNEDAAQQGLTLRPLLSRRHQAAFEREGLAWLLDQKVADPLYEERVHRIIVQLRAAMVCRAFLEHVGWTPPPEDLRDFMGSTGPLFSRRNWVRRNYSDLAGLIEHLPVTPLIRRIFWALNKEANEAKHQTWFNSRM